MIGRRTNRRPISLCNRLNHPKHTYVQVLESWEHLPDNRDILFINRSVGLGWKNACCWFLCAGEVEQTQFLQMRERLTVSSL